jgi:hypothetical protein
VWWCGGVVVVWWCGGVVVWWCGGVVVWWCGRVCVLSWCVGDVIFLFFVFCFLFFCFWFLLVINAIFYSRTIRIR